MIYKNSPGERLFDVFLYTLMAIIFLLMVYPFLYVFNYSISSVAQVKNPLLIIPEGLQLESYAIIFRDATMYRAMLVSVTRSVVGPLFMLMVTATGGYVISRPHLVFGKFFRMFFLFTMYLNAGIIPVYLVMQALGLTNSFLVYIVPMAVNAFFMMLVKTYIEGIPSSLEEAVLIDGGTEFDAYFRVILRLCLPVNAAILLFACIQHWNSFIDTQLYNAMSPKLYTMQYVLYNALAVQMQQSLEEAKQRAGNIVSSQSLKMAITVVTIVPIMCVYPFLQRYFVSGMLVGSIKA
jgi:ABC-type glycerol-3-phosphate transport system permease component